MAKITDDNALEDARRSLAIHRQEEEELHEVAMQWFPRAKEDHKSAVSAEKMSNACTKKGAVIEALVDQIRKYEEMRKNAILEMGHEEFGDEIALMVSTWPPEHQRQFAQKINRAVNDSAAPKTPKLKAGSGQMP